MEKKEVAIMPVWPACTYILDVYEGAVTGAFKCALEGCLFGHASLRGHVPGPANPSPNRSPTGAHLNAGPLMWAASACAL